MQCKRGVCLNFQSFFHHGVVLVCYRMEIVILKKFFNDINFYILY